eukprot:3540488-Pyramimonas_sp.AAC.2
MQCAPTQATRAPLRSTIERPRVQTRARVVRHVMEGRKAPVLELKSSAVSPTYCVAVWNKLCDNQDVARKSAGGSWASRTSSSIRLTNQHAAPLTRRTISVRNHGRTENALVEDRRSSTDGSTSVVDCVELVKTPALFLALTALTLTENSHPPPPHQELSPSPNVGPSEYVVRTCRLGTECGDWLRTLSSTVADAALADGLFAGGDSFVGGGDGFGDE